MHDAVQDYVDGIPPEHRPLFDRIDTLIREAVPDATVRISYDMPTYETGGHRLYVGAWQHGVSLYGWRQDGDGGFVERHPELRHGKGTIRLRPDDAAAIPDDELADLIRATLAP